MEVSQDQALVQDVTKAGSPNLSEGSSEDPSGHELIRSLSAIAGLGEESVKSQVAEMLSVSGQQASGNDFSGLSLEQLRAAMLVYLETLNADMERADAESNANAGGDELSLS
jgi:hypothetical protein